MTSFTVFVLFCSIPLLALVIVRTVDSISVSYKLSKLNKSIFLAASELAYKELTEGELSNGDIYSFFTKSIVLDGLDREVKVRAYKRFKVFYKEHKRRLHESR